MCIHIYIYIHTYLFNCGAEDPECPFAPPFRAIYVYISIIISIVFIIVVIVIAVITVIRNIIILRSLSVLLCLLVFSGPERLRGRPISYYTILYDTILYYVILERYMLYFTILYYAMIYYTIPYKHISMHLPGRERPQGRPLPPRPHVVLPALRLVLPEEAPIDMYLLTYYVIYRCIL